MSHEKPDMIRQSEGFERVHEGLTVSLIATRRNRNENLPLTHRSCGRGVES